MNRRGERPFAHNGAGFRPAKVKSGLDPFIVFYVELHITHDQKEG